MKVNSCIVFFICTAAAALCSSAEDGIVQNVTSEGNRVMMEMQIVCETNIVFDADNICRHEVTTNAYPIYRYPDGREVRFDIEKLEKLWNGMHTVATGREALHGKKGHTVITNGVKYISYKDGYVYQEAMKPRRDVPRKSRLLTPFSKATPVRSHLSPRTRSTIGRQKEQRVIDTLYKTNYINAVFSPGGKVEIIKEETR